MSAAIGATPVVVEHSRRTPQTGGFLTALFVFCIAVVKHAELEGMFASHFGEVVLPSVQILPVVPGRKNSEVSRAPTDRFRQIASVELAGGIKHGRHGCNDLFVQSWIVTGAQNVNAIRGPRELEVIYRLSADGGSQF